MAAVEGTRAAGTAAGAAEAGCGGRVRVITGRRGWAMVELSGAGSLQATLKLGSLRD